MSAIYIENLRKAYKRGKSIALDGLTLRVPEGSLFGLVGPNGAGKTTFIHILAGLIPKDLGQIAIMGKEIGRNDYLHKREMGFVLDHPLYFDKLTGEEYLGFVADMYGMNRNEAQSKIKELLVFFDLEQARHSYIQTYSKGMKQKVSLAAGIIHEPRLLVLDEPFEGLDPGSAEAIGRLLIQTVDKGNTVLITSHMLEIIETLCTHCAIMHQGKIIFQSPMDQLETYVKQSNKKNPQSPLKQIFLQVTSSDHHRTLSWL